MTITPQELSLVIGSKVRDRRNAIGSTIDQLAEEAGVSRRVIINIEQGDTVPNISTLLRIGEVLGMSLPELVDTSSASHLVVTKKDQAAILWSSPNGGTGSLVASTTSPNLVELWEWHMNPGDEHNSEAHISGTRELIHVSQGILTVKVDNDVVTLKPGDSISFAGDVPHSYINLARKPTRFTLAVVEPTNSANTRKGKNNV